VQGEDMKQQDPLVLVFSRNRFYKRMHYLALASFALSLFVIALLLWALVYMGNNPRPPLYFATDKVGRLVKSVPVSKPNMSQKEVEAWVIQAMESAFSYDYVNYRRQLQTAQKYFTNYGWRQYMNALRESNNLVALTQRQMVVSARVAYEPKLVTKGLISGAYAWKYNLRLLITYSIPPYDRQSTFKNPLDVSVIVQRQPELQSYQGLGVLQAIGQISQATPRQTRPITSTPVR
jgi:intracellular multiplication protein IcmL